MRANGFLMLNGKKMSKSEGNFMTMQGKLIITNKYKNWY